MSSGWYIGRFFHWGAVIQILNNVQLQTLLPSDLPEFFPIQKESEISGFQKDFGCNEHLSPLSGPVIVEPLFSSAR